MHKDSILLNHDSCIPFIFLTVFHFLSTTIPTYLVSSSWYVDAWTSEQFLQNAKTRVSQTRIQTPVTPSERHLERSQNVSGLPGSWWPPWNFLASLQVSLRASYGSLNAGLCNSSCSLLSKPGWMSPECARPVSSYRNSLLKTPGGKPDEPRVAAATFATLDPAYLIPSQYLQKGVTCSIYYIFFLVSSNSRFSGRSLETEQDVGCRPRCRGPSGGARCRRPPWNHRFLSKYLSEGVTEVWMQICVTQVAAFFQNRAELSS